jgi:hypothetical protein
MFQLVRAYSISSLRTVTIPAQDFKPWWIVILAKPIIHGRPPADHTYGPTMTCSVSTDVINGEERDPMFSAA